MNGIIIFDPWNLVRNCTLSVPVGISMAKIEAFDNSHFMYQTVRFCHTDHTDSIVSSMACMVDLKNKFLYNRKITLL